MSGTIKIDYDETLKVAQEFDSAADAIADCQSRTDSVISGLSTWEGQSASKAKETLGLLKESLGDFDRVGWKIGAFFSHAAELLPKADQDAAAAIAAIDADWHPKSTAAGAGGPASSGGGSGVAGSTGGAIV